MSLKNYVRYRRGFNNSALLKLIRKSLPNHQIKLIEYNQNQCLFYAYNASTKGVNLNIDYAAKTYEIENMFMSNSIDYKISNAMASALCFLNKENEVKDEEGNVVSFTPLISPLMAEAIQERDAKLMQQFTEEGNWMTVYGPIRKVHIGKSLSSKIQSISDVKELTNYFEKLILKVNYEIPNYSYGNVMETDSTANGKLTLKLLTNKTNCIIDKYDYIMIESEEETIMITNNILNTILPKEYQLVDAYTIVAPVIHSERWQVFKEKAILHNVWKKFKKDNLN